MTTLAPATMLAASMPMLSTTAFLRAHFLLTFVCISIAHADVSVTIAQQTPDETGHARFELIVLNDDADHAAEYAAPDALPVTLSTASGSSDETATRVDAKSNFELRSGGFARVAYRVERRIAGVATIQLRGPAAVASAAPTTGQAVAAPPRTTLGLFSAQPLESIVQQDPNYHSELGLVEFLANRIKPHEPVYIVAGDAEQSTRFQFSFKYQVLDPEGPLAKKLPPLGGVYFAYSQTSLWDLGADSSPFYDSSYRPEVLLSYDKLDRFAVNNAGDRLLPQWLTLSLQGGLRHESNGRSGDESRSLNIVYLRPIVTFAGHEGWFLTLAPTVFAYVFDLGDNPDISDYRGHAELRVVAGQGGGVQLAAIARMGDTAQHKGSLELDLSVPIRKLTLGNLDVYFHTQYFMGYGETLLTYDDPTYALRFGIALVR